MEAGGRIIGGGGIGRRKIEHGTFLGRAFFVERATEGSAIVGPGKAFNIKIMIRKTMSFVVLIMISSGDPWPPSTFLSFLLVFFFFLYQK